MEHLLAKSKPRTTLFRHSMDVVRQMAEYHRLYEPGWPLPEQLVILPRVLAYAALVHDFGKAHSDFQALLSGGKKKFANRHEILSLSFLDWLDIPVEEQRWVESAVALHHKNLHFLTAPGQPFFLGKVFGSPGTSAAALADGITSREARLLHMLLSHAAEIFHETGWPKFPLYEVKEYRELDYLALMKASLQRVDCLARQFEAQTDDFGRVHQVPWRLRRGGIQVRGLILSADHLASAQPRSLRVGLQSAAEVRAAIKKKSGISELNSHQRALAGHDGSAVLVAPTGTGKTEAALLWSAKQAESGLRGRIFVLLPYQTSMNAMQQRLIETFVPEVRECPESWTEHVAMVHGRSVRAAYERLMEKEYGPLEATRTARMAEDLARLDVSPMRICSPYQILWLLFEPKGVEALMQSLSDAKLVFDEVHAYKPGVTALMLAAAQFLTEQVGARVLFMTATLPAHLAAVVRETFGGLPILRPETDVMDRPPRHQVHILPHNALSAESLAAIKKAAESGSVLVVVNQIRRAIALVQGLKMQIGDLHLLHSRFTNQDRFVIEKHLKPCAGRVLVSTQAVEVSLDISYDTCFSELAPLESLLQRFGRCNRYGNEHGTPSSVWVYRDFPESGGGSLPYDEDHLTAVRTVLGEHIERRDGILREAEIEAMLNASYPGNLKSELGEQIAHQSRRIRERFSRDFKPFGRQDQSHFADLEEQWESLFDGHEVLPASLYDEAAMKESWLARARYFVPISGRKFSQLKRQKQIEWCDDLMCHIVKAPYTEVGLEV